MLDWQLCQICYPLEIKLLLLLLLSMWRRLVNDHRIRIPRRKAHRLVRHRYYAQSPNYVWHVDGYDKLKPYGFCIHGAIDVYSRRILWLEVLNFNNSSICVLDYFVVTAELKMQSFPCSNLSLDIMT